MKLKYVLLFSLIAFVLTGCSRNFSDSDSSVSFSISSTKAAFDRVLVSWNDPSGISSSDKQFFDVYRSESSGMASSSVVVTGDASVNQLTDSTCSENTTYFYKVVCKDALGNIKLTTPEVSATTIASSSFTFVVATANTVPTATITLKTTDYYPYASYKLYRITGNIAQLDPSPSIFITSGEISSFSSTINIIDISGTVTPSLAVVPGSTYSYQAFLTLFNSNVVDLSNNIVSSNVVKIKY